MYSTRNCRAWRVIYVWPKREKRLKESLDELEVENYLPLINEVRKWSDRMKKIEVPLFSGYLFAKVDPIEMEKILRIPEALKFVSVNGNRTDSVVSDKDIEVLRKLPEGNPELLNSNFHQGEKVKITNGHFIGQEGILVKNKGGKRLILRVECIRQSVLVDISPNQVENSAKTFLSV